MRGVLWVGMALLSFGDLASLGRRENPVADPAIFGPFETVDFLQTHLGGGRIYSRFDHLSYSHGGWKGGTASFRYAIEGLPHETPLLFGIPTANCATPLRLARYERVSEALTINWLRHLGVKYLLSPSDLGLPVLLDTGRTLVSEVPAPATRFSLAAHLSFVVDQEEIFERTARELDVNGRVYVEGEGEDLPAAPALHGRLRIERSEPSRHLLSVSIDRSAFLLVHSVYHRGWHARLDGRGVPVYRANYLFWGIVVPPGSHRIELLYRPGWFFPLLGVSALSFLLTLFGFVREALRPCRGDPFFLDPDASRSGEGRIWWIVVLFLLLLGDAFLRHPDLWRLSTLRFPG
ncbi:MAG: hypothetical protein D6812_05805 [Deltaproteobacteria bacterium]|nr:MAG: hypothetical protein D6812_05805 [Deltaproteobacteria bacterium]